MIKSSNLVQENVNFLASFSTKWWDPNGAWKSLHVYNQVRVPLVLDGLVRAGIIKTGDDLKNIKVLDVGCGAGILSEALKNMNADVTGLDVSAEIIDVAKDHAANQSLDIDYVCNFIENFSINNREKFDVVIASEVLEHIPDHKSFLLECIKCLKVGGSLFLTTQNKGFMSWIGTKIFGEYVLGILPIGTHDTNLFPDLENVKEIVRDANCDVIHTTGILYDWIRSKAFFWRYEGMQYALQAVKMSETD